MTKAELVHVPYKGTGPAITDLVGGQVQISFATLASVLPYVQGGRLRAIAVAGERRAASLPAAADVRRGRDEGLRSGAVVLAAGPRENAAPGRSTASTRRCSRRSASPQIRERLVAQGFDPQTSTPEQLAQRISQDLARWDRVVKDAGIKLEQ